MAKRSKVRPSHKTQYRVTNWPEYDRGLVNRGSLTVWFPPAALDSWKPRRNGRRGGQRRYCDTALSGDRGGAGWGGAEGIVARYAVQTRRKRWLQRPVRAAGFARRTES
jgi:hypothetical protein